MDDEIKAILSTIVKEIHNIKNDIQSVKIELKDDIKNVERRTTGIELTLENVTNRNIQLLAENHMNLIDKLNQAVKVSDKTLLYEIQVETLKSKVDKLEKEIAEIKKHIA